MPDIKGNLAMARASGNRRKGVQDSIDEKMFDEAWDEITTGAYMG